MSHRPWVLEPSTSFLAREARYLEDRAVNSLSSTTVFSPTPGTRCKSTGSASSTPEREPNWARRA